LNTNTANGNFGIYQIEENGNLYKIGKADLNRVTKSTNKPTRLHQQVVSLNKNGKGDVYTGKVIKEGYPTTLEAKNAEKARLDEHYSKTGNIPEGNRKSYTITNKKGTC
jgi:hypothetical protein